MLIQRAGSGTLPPPGFAAPPWAHLAAHWAAIPPPATPTAVLGPCTLTLGHDDPEARDVLPACAADAADRDHVFGWDNESPARRVAVRAFRAAWRPISNGEFLRFWRERKGEVALPASWVEEGGEVKVRLFRIEARVCRC